MFCARAILTTLSLASASFAGVSGVSLELYTNVVFPAIMVAHEPGDTDDTLYVLLRGGRILSGPRSDPGSLGTFMSIPGVASGFEGGAVGLAFHPDYQNNRKFYVFYTEASAPLRSVVEEFSATPDGLTGDVSSARRLLSIEQSSGLHQSGWIGFGPNDGYLYISVGDDAVPANGQDTSTIKGNVLRIDVDSDDFPADTARNYAIPASNPFVGVAGSADEIWVSGLRNPYRCSFDRETGDLYITDVGAGSREEVSVIPASSTGGENLGWTCREGTNCQNAGCCNDAGFMDPVFEYAHADGCAIIGGRVYRGCAMPDLHGTYFFADLCRTTINSFVWDGGASVTNLEFPSNTLSGVNSPVGFGEDSMGELYVCTLGGQVFKIVPTSPIDNDGNGVVDSCEGFLCLGDCDQNGTREFNDLVSMLFEFGTPGTNPGCDADESGTVDFNDLVATLFLFGPCQIIAE